MRGEECRYGSWVSKQSARSWHGFVKLHANGLHPACLDDEGFGESIAEMQRVKFADRSLVRRLLILGTPSASRAAHATTVPQIGKVLSSGKPAEEVRRSLRATTSRATPLGLPGVARRL